MKFHRIPSPNLLVVVIACWVTSCGQQQTKTDVEQPGQEQATDSIVEHTNVEADTLGMPTTEEEIRYAHAAIMTKLNDGRLDSTSFTYSCNNEKSGTVSYYSDNGQLCMIVHRYNEYDHHAAEDAYFVQDSTLFFAYLKRTLWSFTSGPEGATKDDITEQRIYMVDGQPMHCLEKKFTIHSHAASNPTADEVPNKKVDCASAGSVTDPYQTLVKYQHDPTSGCLTE